MLRLYQSLAIVEVIHASIGLVRSSVITTLIQISSRLFIVWGIVYLLPEVTRENFGVPLIIISWSIAEMVRYAYYMADICGVLSIYGFISNRDFRKSLKIHFKFLFQGEILLVLGGIKSLKETGKYSVNLPNALNCSFSYLVVLVVALIIYVPGSKTMYTHMLRQRKKILWKKD
ncbi:unnamed protein product [Trichobilharzia regenti]|nr:unnamed protein product [Trichobilharzia regenti]